MKKLLLLSLVLLTGTSFAQNVQDQKVTFTYIQWPTKPVGSGVTSYEIQIIDNSEKNNEDSMAVYQTKLDAAKLKYETEEAGWLEEKKKLDRLYLTQMATWQKAVNGGSTTAVKPPAPAYKPHPLLDKVYLPILSEKINENTINQGIDFKGYSKGSGGAVLKMEVEGFKNTSVRMVKAGTGAATKYNYTFSYSMPITLKVESPSKGVVWEKRFNGGATSTKSYASQYEFDIWWMDNREQFWKDVQNGALAKTVASINGELNETCGFPKKSRSTEVYTIKKYKEHNYSDLVDAFTAVKQGYDALMKDKDKGDAIPKLNQAIQMWEAALGESDLNDNKSRINKKATAMLYANLAEAYLWADNFEMADSYINKAINISVSKYKTHCKRMQEMVKSLKMRYESNH